MSEPVLRSRSLADSARVRAAAVGEGDGSAAFGVAVVDGTTRWSWRDLDLRADRVARQLTASGAGPGDRIALLAAPSAAAIAALHGIARLGAAVAPLAPTMSRTELAAAGEVIRAGLVVCGAGLEGQASGLAGRVVALDDLVASAPGVASDLIDVDLELPASRADAPAVIVLTSGTTSRPKAAILSTQALAASAEAWLTALPPATGWLLALGLSHIAGIGVVWRAALSGVPLVVVDRPDAAAIAAALAADPAPSHVSLVPTLLARILDATENAPPPATLRAVPLGGGPIPANLVLRALAAGWPVVPTYGLTEAGSGVAALPTAEAADHPESAGRPLPTVDVRIARPDSDGVGEIQVRSPALFSGYLDEEVATRDAWTPDGWLRTGDLGRLDDGRLTVVDRRTDRIVRGGENIAPAEVEAVLLGHPAIADAGVVARRDPAYGHAPVAGVVLRGGVPDPGDDALAAYCREHLALFKVPVAFVRLAAMPRTDGGKLRRAELRERLDRPPDPGGDPEGPRERRVDRPDGTSVAYRSFGQGPVHVLLLHATLSSAGQLTSLARHLAADGRLTVHAVDRRGSGGSRLAEPRSLDIAVHVEDLAALLDAERVPAAVLVGVSYGGVVAIEFAARLRNRARAVVAYEPPYGPVAGAETRRAFARVAADTERAYAAAGSAAAAEAFMAGVAGPEAWGRLSERARGYLAEAGGSAVVEAGLRGLDADGLARIDVPALILTGGASGPFYLEIAHALVDRIRGAEQVRLPGLAHTAPMTDPGAVGDAVLQWLPKVADVSANGARNLVSVIHGRDDEAR